MSLLAHRSLPPARGTLRAYLLLQLECRGGYATVSQLTTCARAVFPRAPIHGIGRALLSLRDTGAIVIMLDGDPVTFVARRGDVAVAQ